MEEEKVDKEEEGEELFQNGDDLQEKDRRQELLKNIQTNLLFLEEKLVRENKIKPRTGFYF